MSPNRREFIGAFAAAASAGSLLRPEVANAQEPEKQEAKASKEFDLEIPRWQKIKVERLKDYLAEPHLDKLAEKVKRHILPETIIGILSDFPEARDDVAKLPELEAEYAASFAKLNTETVPEAIRLRKEIVVSQKKGIITSYNRLCKLYDSWAGSRKADLHKEPKSVPTIENFENYPLIKKEDLQAWMESVPTEFYSHIKSFSYTSADNPKSNEALAVYEDDSKIVFYGSADDLRNQTRDYAIDTLGHEVGHSLDWRQQNNRLTLKEKLEFLLEVFESMDGERPKLRYIDKDLPEEYGQPENIIKKEQLPARRVQEYWADLVAKFVENHRKKKYQKPLSHSEDPDLTDKQSHLVKKWLGKQGIKF
jgi:hypothetical protein